jgi:hypothetical protein
MGWGLSFEKQQNPFLSSLSCGCIKSSSLRKKKKMDRLAPKLQARQYKKYKECNNLHKRYYTDPVLATIMGRPTTSRPVAVKQFGTYIKRPNCRSLKWKDYFA